jgi:hypothetical protein
VREPSGSKLALAALCQHPFTSGETWPPDKESQHSAFGHRVGEACEALVTGGHVYPAVTRGLDELEREKLLHCVARARAHLERERVNLAVEAARLATEAKLELLEERAEMWARYDVEASTARWSERFERRQAGCWNAVLDYVARLGDEVLVIDWKTGKQAATAATERNPQIRLYAIAAARLFHVRRVRVQLVHLDADGATVDEATFGAFELAEIADEMRELRARLTRGPTPPVPGPHCTTHFCPMRGTCSATQAALASAYQLERPLSPKIQNDDHARFILERLPAARAALAGVEDAIKNYAARQPFRLADGRVYGKHEKSKRSVDIDTPEREAALRGVLGIGADFAIKSEPQVSLERIEEGARIALGESPPRGAKTALVREALAALEAAGGYKVNTYYAVEAFNAKEESA